MTAKLVISSQFVVISLFVFFLGLFLYPIPQTLNPTFAKAATSSANPNVASQSATNSAQIVIATPNPNYQPLGQVSPQSPQYANLMVNNLIHAFSCLMVGASPIGQQCIDYLNGVPVVSSVNNGGGLLGTTTNMLTMVIANPPIRTGQYLANLGDSLNLTKEANAQVTGSGAGVLEPIINLWQVSRNIAYIIMILIFVIIGMMIMFRTRINPQTVISVQAALPGLVIGLILITFSYFLASMLTDTAYLATNLVGYYFQAAQGGDLSRSLVENTADKSMLQMVGGFSGVINKEDTTGAVAALWDSLPDNVERILTLAAGFLAFQYGSSLGNVGLPIVQGAVGLLTAVTTVIDPQAIIGLVLYLIALAVLIYNMLQLLIRLINNYLQIIFLTVTAPFHFMVASLPGRQGIVTDWIRNMLCNVLSFPAVLAVFYFVAFLLSDRNQPVIKEAFSITSTLSLTGSSTLPLLGGLNLDFIRFLLAYGALIATPKIPDIICEVIGKVGRAGAMIGQEIQGETRAGIAYIQRGAQGVGQAEGGLGGAFVRSNTNPATGEIRITPGPIPQWVNRIRGRDPVPRG